MQACNIENTMKRLFISIIAAGAAIAAFSDAQFCEVIQDNGVRKGLCTSVLDRDEERSAQLNESITSEFCNTALYRNYIGYWKIQNDSLFLDSLLIHRKRGDELSKMELGSLYASLKTPSGYFVDWISDTIRIVSGKIVRYEHMSWHSTWETEEFVTVDKGIITGREAKYSKLINPRMHESDQLKIIKELDLGVIPNRIVLTLRYSGFDEEGQPTGLDISVRKGCGDSAIDERVVNAVDSAFMIHKPFPIYCINGIYETETWMLPIAKRE